MTLAALHRWRVALCRALALAMMALAAQLAGASTASAQERVQITDPFIEMRTGPGRGFPIYYVAPRGEWIELLMRRTDWYKVRTVNGREGWVNREQLATTLTEAGTSTAFRDILIDDYLRRKLEVGAAWGQFKGEPMLKIWTGYKFGDALSLEGTIGQVQGVFSGTEFWHVNLNVEPWSDKRLSPFFGIGLGRFRNIPNASLVNAVETNANLADALIGLRFYVTDRFVARLDWGIYTAYVSDLDSAEYKAATLGIAFFF
jgi:hypothetical protein